MNDFNGDGLGEGSPTALGAKTAEAFDMQNKKSSQLSRLLMPIVLV
jgi:hypothetical protein